MKLSDLEKKTNKNIALVFFFQIFICLLGAIGDTFWTLTSGVNNHKYIAMEEYAELGMFTTFMFNFGTWMLLFANLIPIALIVTMEVVKFTQAQFFTWDASIYDCDKDMETRVQSSNLNESLGQISYVFSDKTGTLTCNVMNFKKMSIGDQSYGLDKSDAEEAKKRGISNFQFEDPEFVRQMRDKSHPNYENIKQYMVHLALCHTIVVQEEDGKITYNASSPDELALVNCAKFFNYEFMGRDEQNNIVVMVDGEKRKYKLLNVIEFNSDRKRMTVVVQTSHNKVRVLCKGADSIIMERLEPGCKYVRETSDYLEEYASSGLRTLALAQKDLSMEEYTMWEKKMTIAASALKNRDAEMDKVSNELEINMQLLGSTAIEDKLQDNVPDTIQFLKDANIKVWVLTGDKIETAINIGFSCSLLNSRMERYIINAKSSTGALEQISSARKLQIKSEGFRQSATIVTGEALLKITAHERIKFQFLKLACSSAAIIACRMSPKQKADIVRMIQAYDPSATTLGIGDGANDVNMITAAHIGVGISGLEGQ